MTDSKMLAGRIKNGIFLNKLEFSRLMDSVHKIKLGVQPEDSAFLKSCNPSVRIILSFLEAWPTLNRRHKGTIFLKHPIVLFSASKCTHAANCSANNAGGIKVSSITKNSLLIFGYKNQKNETRQ